VLFAPLMNWGIATVAAYAFEDRNSPHRLADEAYQIGEVGHPVRAYLSVDEIVAPSGPALRGVRGCVSIQLARRP
jgi:pyruvate carboxylase